MWNSNPAGSGTVLTWPPASGDVLVANGKTITINVNTNLGPTGELRHDTTGGATAGGQFNYASGVSVTANAYGGASGQCVSSVFPGFFVGNVYAGTGAFALVVQHTTGTFTITGHAIASSGADALYAIPQGSGAILNFTGSATGSSGTTSRGIYFNGLGTINMVGTATGGSSANSAGVRCQSTGAINVTGDVIAGSGSPGAYNNTTGTITISGYALASTNQPGVQNVGTGVLSVGETRSASNGRGAILGAFRYASATAAKSLQIIAGSQQTLSVLDVAALAPAIENVRSGLVYGDGAYTGTLALQRKRTTMAGRF